MDGSGGAVTAAGIERVLNMARRFATLAAVLFAAASLFGQNLASLSGTVTDPSGAVIPGASLQLKNTDTQVSRETVSDDQGRYAFPQMQPGSYQLSAKAKGFNDVIVNNVVLQVNVPATENVSFEKLGAVTEVIAVSAEGVQVNTTDASLGNAIGGAALTRLPSFARNIVGLLAFQPGVTFDGSVNGGKTDQGNVTLDGVDVNDQQDRYAFTSVIRITLDSVQEFRTTTMNANADQGRTSGGQVSLITRSGTNNLHGAAYELHRNTATAANDFFNNSSSVKRPALLIDVFGARVDGSIKRNKAFFMVNYEGRRDRSAANVLRTVPSDLLRQGIVQYRTASGAINRLTPADIRTRIDPAGIGVNQASLALFNTYPTANDFTVGDGLNIVGHRFTAGRHTKQDTYISKLDYVWSDKHSFFARGNLQNDHSAGIPQYPGDPPRSVGLNNSKGIALGATSLLRPTLINTFRYGITRQGWRPPVSRRDPS